MEKYNLDEKMFKDYFHSLISLVKRKMNLNSERSIENITILVIQIFEFQLNNSLQNVLYMGYFINILYVNMNDLCIIEFIMIKFN